MTTAEKKRMTREEQIELQRQVTAEHIQGENDGEYEPVRQTFVQDDRSYFDCVPGGIHFDGTSGIQGWYDILGAMLPDLVIEVTHEYDTVGACLREMTASGTHSLEFAGVKPTGKYIKWEAIALYIFDAEEPGKLLAERAYWDNDALIKLMKGEEAPPLLGLAENPRILEQNSVKYIHKPS
jgi:hypothetical protein